MKNPCCHLTNIDKSRIIYFLFKSSFLSTRRPHLNHLVVSSCKLSCADHEERDIFQTLLPIQTASSTGQRTQLYLDRCPHPQRKPRIEQQQQNNQVYIKGFTKFCVDESECSIRSPATI